VSSSLVRSIIAEFGAVVPIGVNAAIAAAGRRLLEAATIEGFVQALFAEADGFVRLRAFHPVSKAQETALVRGPEAVREFASRWRDTHDVYFSVATTRDGTTSTKRDVVSLVTAHVDLDFRGKDEGEMLQRLLDLKPSIVVHSGGGLHGYWIFPKPLGPDQIPRVENINRALIRRLGADKGTHDAVRLLRLPESFNHKPCYAKPAVRIIHLDPAILARIPRRDRHEND
jgi:hypothetical protein